jgi:hypothetical protein
MKRLVLLSLALFAGCQSLHADEVRDLILVAGQSNAVGYDAYASELPAHEADKTVLFWWRCGDPPPDLHDSTGARKWTSLQPQPLGDPIPKVTGSGDTASGLKRQYGNFGKPEGGFGPEMGLARALAGKESRPLAILKVAFSGTSLEKDWGPALPDPGGDCYRALISEYVAAIAAAKEAKVTLRPRALVWVQGESDATAMAAPPYEKALGEMLGALRREIEAPDLILLLAVNTRFGNGKNPHMPAVIAAQKALGESIPRCDYVDTEGAGTLEPSHTHFTASGTIEVGERFATALLEAEKE